MIMKASGVNQHIQICARNFRLTGRKRTGTLTDYKFSDAVQWKFMARKMFAEIYSSAFVIITQTDCVVNTEFVNKNGDISWDIRYQPTCLQLKQSFVNGKSSVWIFSLTQFARLLLVFLLWTVSIGLLPLPIDYIFDGC